MTASIDQIIITYRDIRDDRRLPIYITVFDNSLSRKWLQALNHNISHDLHLEKNYCFLGFTENARDADYILGAINASIDAINAADLGYRIDDYFTWQDTVNDGDVGDDLPGLTLRADRMNWLHRYFEDLQGHSGAMSVFYQRADADTRWHIRQLNLLCHEFESLVLSMRKDRHAPEWRRPSQLMCWLNAPRFTLEKDDLELFGIDTIARPLGGVFVGVNKAVGKHHWEVFLDEGRDIGELVTTSLQTQTEAAGDFDIEWANNPGEYEFMKQRLRDFRQWLIHNGFDPDDRNLTLGHPQVGAVDLERSFGTQDYRVIWQVLADHLDVVEIRTSEACANYDYHWSDPDYHQQQIRKLS
jgi:hypothetical protein